MSKSGCGHDITQRARRQRRAVKTVGRLLTLTVIRYNMKQTWRWRHTHSTISCTHNGGTNENKSKDDAAWLAVMSSHQRAEIKKKRTVSRQTTSGIGIPMWTILVPKRCTTWHVHRTHVTFCSITLHHVGWNNNNNNNIKNNNNSSNNTNNTHITV